MTISYSGITNYGKVTLPAVVGGLGSMYIKKEPTKSIMTRKIDKVGDSNIVLDALANSNDRFCEAINTYARGVNPSVSVSYSNYGNNGGQKSGGILSKSIGSSKQAYSPYTIMRDGAFRPPIMTQEQLLPLSRQPRLLTSMYTKKATVDYSKKVYKLSKKYRSVKKNTINGCIRPTSSYKVEKPMEKPHETRFMVKKIQKVNSRAGVSGVRTRDLTKQTVKKPASNIKKYLKGDMKSNKSVRFNLTKQHVITPVKNIKSIMKGSMKSNKSTGIVNLKLQNNINTDNCTKELFNIKIDSTKTGTNKQKYIHKTPSLKTPTVKAHATTNKHKNIYVRNSHNNTLKQKQNRPIATRTSNRIQRHFTNNAISGRTHKLKQTISAGSFDGRGIIPNNKRIIL